MNKRKVFNVQFTFVEGFFGVIEDTRKRKYATKVTAQSAEEALEKAKEEAGFSKQGLGSESVVSYKDIIIKKEDKKSE